MTATLIAYGRIGWDQIGRMLAGAEAAWADYDGFHIGAPPESPPPYSHLWAWTPGWLARLRLDGQDAITGVLALRAEPENCPPEHWRRTVEYRQIRSGTWPQTEKRVGPLAADVAGRVMEVYLVGGEHPVTFVASAPLEAPVGVASMVTAGRATVRSVQMISSPVQVGG